MEINRCGLYLEGKVLNHLHTHSEHNFQDFEQNNSFAFVFSFIMLDYYLFGTGNF